MSVINKDEWINRWIKKAETDLSAAEKLCSFPDMLSDIVCFHCQQAVELNSYAVDVRYPGPNDSCTAYDAGSGTDYGKAAQDERIS